MKKYGYFIPFLSLTILCGTSHEFVHHFTGALICGCFGYKTFNSFDLCPGCFETNPLWYWATYAGPIFTFALIWVGLYQLRQTSMHQKQLGFALIFANFPINRIVFAFMGANDEQYAARILWGADNAMAHYLTIAGVLLLSVPPLYYAFKAIRAKRRLAWFLGYFILPFVFVILFAGLVLEEWLLLQQQFLADTIIGIPYLILIVEVVFLILYRMSYSQLYKSPLINLK